MLAMCLIITIFNITILLAEISNCIWNQLQNVCPTNNYYVCFKWNKITVQKDIINYFFKSKKVQQCLKPFCHNILVYVWVVKWPAISCTNIQHSLFTLTLTWLYFEARANKDPILPSSWGAECRVKRAQNRVRRPPLAQAEFFLRKMYS